MTHNLTNWGAIDQLKHEQLIPNETAETLKIKTPQFHMIPKIHTIGNPGKPVVSSIGSIILVFQILLTTTCNH